MAVKFFLRNSPDTIKAAVDLSREDFIEKFSNTTAGREILYKAWDEIRHVHLPKNHTKEVKFKVVQTDNKVIPFSTKVKKEEDNRDNALANAARGRDESGINEDELQITGSGKTALDPVRVKSNRGRRRLKNADQRDARILELLKTGEKGQDILMKMKKEGFSVHAPQITYIKQANKL